MTTQTRRWLFVTAIFHSVVLLFIFRYTPDYLLPIDDWTDSRPVALAYVNGTNPISDFFEPNNYIHMSVPTRITTYVLTALTDWNLLVAALLNYGLAVINLAILGWWFLHERPQWGFLLVIPLTALVLSPQQEVNWIANFHSAWHYAVMFALLAMVLITRQPQSFRNVVGAAIFALLSSFTLLVGFAAWGVVLLGLWLMGYRRWQVYGFWLLVIAVVAVVYLNIPGIDPGQGALLEEGDALVQSVRVTDYAFFIITFLGNSFAYGYDSNILIPMFMSLLGIGLFVANVRFLWADVALRGSIAKALMLAAYAGGVGMLMSVGRVSSFGVRWGMANHYITASLLVWVGLAALIVMTLHKLFSGGEHVRHRVLVLANGFVVIFAVSFYLYSAVMIFNVTEDDQRRVAQIEVCMQAVVADEQDEGCTVNGGLARPEWIREIAAAKLTGFAGE